MYNKFIHLLWWLYLLQKSIWGHIYMWRKKNQNKQQGSQRIVSLHSLFPFASGTARIMQNTAKSMTSLTRTSLPSGETEALWLAWSFSTSLYTRSWFSASLHDRTLQAGHFYIKMGLRVWVFFFFRAMVEWLRLPWRPQSIKGPAGVSDKSLAWVEKKDIR